MSVCKRNMVKHADIAGDALHGKNGFWSVWKEGLKMINTIKFSHEYSKLHGQTSATLLTVKTINLVNGKDSEDNDLIEYDTTYYDGNKMYYPLEDGVYLLLVFLGNKNIPFTTIRRWTPEKNRYYCEQIHKDFLIERTFEIKEQL